jgi:flavin reductase (DIM6/NTAB) family NADH-FMN oxidoreductase RutF
MSVAFAPTIVSHQPIDATTFRKAMRHLVGAVSIVTAGRPGDRTGMTATSVSSLSADSSTLIVCVNLSSSTWPILRRERCFGVNVLASEHEPVADRFTGRNGERGEARFVDARWLTLATGAPLLADALVSLDCLVEEVIERHSHAIVVGCVRAFRASEAGGALVYWRGAYEALGWTEAQARSAIGFG